MQFRRLLSQLLTVRPAKQILVGVSSLIGCGCVRLPNLDSHAHELLRQFRFTFSWSLQFVLKIESAFSLSNYPANMTASSLYIRL